MVMFASNVDVELTTTMSVGLMANLIVAIVFLGAKDVIHII